MVVCIEDDRYQMEYQTRGHQKKSWSRVVDDLISSFCPNKAEWVKDNSEGGIFLKGFLSFVGESIINKQESRKFKEGSFWFIDIPVRQHNLKHICMRYVMLGVENCVTATTHAGATVTSRDHIPLPEISDSRRPKNICFP